MFFYGYNMDYVLLLIIAVVLAGLAQAKVSSTYNKYSRVPNRRGLTGEQVAAQMLIQAGIHDVRIERVAMTPEQRRCAFLPAYMTAEA